MDLGSLLSGVKGVLLVILYEYTLCETDCSEYSTLDLLESVEVVTICFAVPVTGTTLPVSAGFARGRRGGCAKGSAGLGVSRFSVIRRVAERGV